MTSPLHVLVATPLGRGGRGGIDRMMDAVANELARTERRDVKVRFVPTRGPGPIIVAPLYFVAFLIRMLALRVLGRCDLVHVNVAQKGSCYRKAIVCKAASWMGLPYVVHLHGSGFDDFWHASTGRVRSTIRGMFRGAATVLVLGSYWRNFVIEMQLVDPERVRIFPNATSSVRVATRRGSPARLLFTGRLGFRKGTPTLIAALARMKARSDWRAVLAGDGDIEGAKAAIAQAGLADRVDVPGWVGPKDVDRLLAASDILVLPSTAENLPMSVIEGMAAGLAIVTTAVGATPDIIADGESGILVAPGDVDAVARALGTLLDNAEMRHRLGANAREYHRRHLSIDNYVYRLAMLWRDAAATRMASPHQIAT
jgi:glycosyltransferase involved in cell wall biosynthesis